MRACLMVLAALVSFLGLLPAFGWAQVEAPAREPSWETLAEAGNRAYRDGQYEEAEAAHRRAVDVAQKMTPGDWRIIISLTNLGHVVRLRGRLAEAEVLYRQAVRAAEELRGEDHPDLIDPLKNLGVFYYEQRWYAQAEGIFARVLRIAGRGSSARDKVRQVAYGNMLAELAEFQGHYEEAGRLQLETLRILGVADPLDRAALGMTLTQLALLLRAQGRDTEGRETAARALQVLAMTGPEGETTLRLAIKFREETLGPEHPAVAKILQPLAFLLEAQGHYADAAEVWRRAIEVLEASRPPGSLDVAASLDAYAALLVKAGLTGEARRAEARAAAIRGR